MSKAKKISLKSLSLKAGSHENPGEGMCIMEAVAYFAGESHSAAPHCACPVLTSYMIKINDSMNDSERKLLKPYIKKLIGTRDGNSKKRMEIFVRSAVSEITPYALRLTKVEFLLKHAETLEKFKKIGTFAEMRAAANDAINAAYAAAYASRAHAAAHAAAYYAANAAALSAATDALSAVYASAAAAAASADASAAAAASRLKVWKIALKALDRALKV